MKLKKIEIRIKTLSEEQQQIADTHSQPPHFQFCGAPEIYFEGTIPVDLFAFKTSGPLSCDDIALQLGKEFIKQIDDHFGVKK